VAAGQGHSDVERKGPSAQSKILVDSNSYFRLAKSVHPLLFQEFGADRHCLYVLPELQQEYDREPRLHAKFPWVDDPDFKENRKRAPALSKKHKRELEVAREFLWDYVQTQLPGPSRVDVTVLSYGYVLGIPVVTDDTDMRALGNAFGVKLLKTLELLKLMLDCGHIDMPKVCAVASYLVYIPDLPKDFQEDYRRLFGEQPPS